MTGRPGRRAAVGLVCVLAAAGCRADDGAVRRIPDSAGTVVAAAERAGEEWRVYNDCAMARNTTWVSRDNGRTWVGHDGPGYINCTSASAVRLRVTQPGHATAEVDHGPEPIHEQWRTADGGKTWSMLSTDLGG